MEDVIKYIEIKNFTPDDADGEYLKTPLQFAVLYHRIEVADYLLRREGVHVSKPTSELWTPLMMASREGDFDILQLILEGPQAEDVEVNGVNHLGQTALHVAVQFCPVPTRLACSQLLLAHGADPNARDEFGRSPIRVATSSSQHALASFLLARTPVPVPPRQVPSRLSVGLSTHATTTDTYGDGLVPGKWVFSGEGHHPGADTRPPIATRRDFS